MSLVRKLKSSRFILFCVVGATSSMIDMAGLYAGVDILHLNLYLAATLSFALASVNGYYLNQRLTFKSSERATLRQYLQFLLISVVGLGLTIFLLHAFTAYAGLHYLIAKIITIILVVFWNYFANVFWTFRKSKSGVVQ